MKDVILLGHTAHRKQTAISEIIYWYGCLG